jgi:hypothetical protein
MIRRENKSSKIAFRGGRDLNQPRRYVLLVPFRSSTFRMIFQATLQPSCKLPEGRFRTCTRADAIGMEITIKLWRVLGQLTMAECDVTYHQIAGKGISQ